jgi:hypothetical protein
MKSSFLRKAEQTMKTLKKCKFVVKESKPNEWNVYCKSIIIAGPLPEKGYADLLASDFNGLAEDRIEEISMALEMAENKLKDLLNNVETAVGGAITGDIDKQAFKEVGAKYKLGDQYTHNEDKSKEKSVVKK